MPAIAGVLAVVFAMFLFYSMHCEPSVRSVFCFLQDVFFSLIFVAILSVIKFLSFITFNIALNVHLLVPIHFR